jgi:BexC/CtrB/KpsE family polysaccharide export inner-membrane protein
MDQTFITSRVANRRSQWLRAKRPNWLFLATVVLPTSIAIVYYGLLASDVYVSESQFVVRSPDKPAASGLGILLKSVGFSNAGDEIYATQDYVVSRDALRDLNRRGAVETAYTRPGISIFDRFNPLGMNGSFEDLYKYYVDKVAVENDSTSSITTLSVEAYSAKDAQRFNEQLLAQAESLVNRLNTRGQGDLVAYARRETEEAEQAGLRASRELARYRDQRGVIDPEKQATVQLQLVSKLQDELIGARTQLAQLRSLAPENPQIPALESRIGSLRREIDVALGRVTGTSGSLSGTAVRYQRLELEREFAAKRLSAALASLQEARNEARRQQAYVERIVQPSLPDEAQLPRRFRGVVATFAFAFIVWSIMTMLIAGIREHGQ